MGSNTYYHKYYCREQPYTDMSSLVFFSTESWEWNCHIEIFAHCEFCYFLPTYPEKKNVAGHIPRVS